MLSDLVLGIFAFYFYSRHRVLSKYWSYFFLFMGFSAIVGGLYHGLDMIGEQFRFLSWSFLAVSIVFAQFAGYKAIDNKALKWLFVMKAMLFLSLSIYNVNFGFMIVEMIISLVGFVILGNLFYLKSMSNTIAYGILISFSSVFFIVFKISIEPNYLTANDLGHYVSVVSLMVMSKGISEDSIKGVLKKRKV